MLIPPVVGEEDVSQRAPLNLINIRGVLILNLYIGNDASVAGEVLRARWFGIPFDGQILLGALDLLALLILLNLFPEVEPGQLMYQVEGDVSNL